MWTSFLLKLVAFSCQYVCVGSRDCVNSLVKHNKDCKFLILFSTIKSWGNVKFRLDLTAIKSKKTFFIIHENISAEFRSPNLGACVICECMWYTNNYGTHNKISSVIASVKEDMLQTALKTFVIPFLENVLFFSYLQFIRNWKVNTIWRKTKSMIWLKWRKEKKLILLSIINLKKQIVFEITASMLNVIQINYLFFSVLF